MMLESVETSSKSFIIIINFIVKHINIAQIYIDQKAFMVEAKDTDISKVAEIVNDTLKSLVKKQYGKVHTLV